MTLCKILISKFFSFASLRLCTFAFNYKSATYLIVVFILKLTINYSFVIFFIYEQSFAIMNKYISIILFSLLFTTATFTDALENSIIPAIEQAEMIENLPVQKYSTNQFAEISSALQHKTKRLRIVTFNMLANDKDHIREEFNRWPQRIARIIETLEEMAPDVVCSQELYQCQLDDLLPHIDATFGFYGEPRSDGELNGVFYRKCRFELVASKVWTIPSIGPITNNVTMLQLKDKLTGQLFAIFNIHLAFGANERAHEIRFILEKVLPVSQQMPVIFTGDLNTFPHRLDLNKLPYYDGDYTHRLVTRSIFKDSAEISLLGHLGPISTFTNAPENGIPFQGTGTPGVMLDHIYVTKEVTVLIHAVQAGTVNNCFPSDHMPVIIDCLIQNDNP